MDWCEGRDLGTEVSEVAELSQIKVEVWIEPNSNVYILLYSMFSILHDIMIARENSLSR